MASGKTYGDHENETFYSYTFIYMQYKFSQFRIINLPKNPHKSQSYYIPESN